MAHPLLFDVGFDFVGYNAGEGPLPDVPAVLQIQPSGSDDTALLQAAIDKVASQTRTATGFCGALVLGPDTFHVEGQLRITTSGIVIRGSMNGKNPTKIIATGKSRRALIETGSGIQPSLAPKTDVSDEFVSAGSRTLSVMEPSTFKIGDRVVIHRPCTEEWIASLGVNRSAQSFADLCTHWRPGSRDLQWNRVITDIDPRKKTITLDVPITTALEKRYGGGTIAKVVAGFPLLRIGIEHLILESEYDLLNAKDEEHAWIAIALDHIEDAWVRGVSARHFVGSAVRIGSHARRVTVEDCRNERPVSEIGGYRRQSFLVYGEQVLVQHCTAESGLNDFAAGFCAAGPNVFRDCEAESALGPSGTFESWSSGVLYDRVRIRGAGLRLGRDDDWTQGAGWTAANSTLLDCEAADLVAEGPEGAGSVIIHRSHEEKASPGGKNIVRTNDEELNARNVPQFIGPPASSLSSVMNPPSNLEIINGRFVINECAVWGGQVNAGWWLGQLSPLAGHDTGVSITRFAPGRQGTGLTEDLPELATRMRRESMCFYGGGPGLWYDRRRDDHSVTARTGSNVWAPFYEMPWARSGQGTAWDGLSKYDLTKFNPWYFGRTREFARLCEQNGLVLYHNLYNTHHVLESQAHWVDFPWRPVNCLNDTGLPDFPPLDAGNAVHLAESFYNVDHPGRRGLHRAYIRHNLDQLGASPNVIFSLAYQFAGPLAFQEFFLNTVAEWERETGHSLKLALITSKDITDAILGDPVRTGQIAVVDMRYWQTQPDGTAWAPRGDQNRAFREMTSEQFGPPYGDTPPPTTPWHVYRQVREYRDRFPGKAIVAWNGGTGPVPAFMAGGAQVLMRNPASGQSQGIESDQTPFDAFVREHLAGTLMKLYPRDNWLMEPERNWCLADSDGKTILFYSLSGPQMMLAQKLPTSRYTAIWFSPRDGLCRSADLSQSWNAGDSLVKPTQEEWLLFLQRCPETASAG